MTPEEDLHRRAIESFGLLNERMVRLMLVQPREGDDPSAFAQGLNGHVDRISLFLKLGTRLFAQSGSPTGPQVGRGSMQGVSVVAFDSGARRLIDAVDAFVDRPDEDPRGEALGEAIATVVEPLLSELPDEEGADAQRRTGVQPLRLVSPGEIAMRSAPSPAVARVSSDGVSEPPRGGRATDPEFDSGASDPQGRVAEDAVPDPSWSAGAAPPPQSHQSLLRPVVEIHRLDENERSWWMGRFRTLSRRVNIGLVVLVVMVLIVVGAGLAVMDSMGVDASRRPLIADGELGVSGAVRGQALQASDASADLARAGALGGASGGGGDEGRIDLTGVMEMLRRAGGSGGGMESLAEAWASGPGASIGLLEGRLAELEMEVLLLRARLDTQEAQELERSADGAASPSGGEGSAGLDVPRASGVAAPGTVVAGPEIGVGEALQVQEAAYGIQLVAVRDLDRAVEFAIDTGFDPSLLLIESSDAWVFVILGLFEDRPSAEVVFATLPETLVRQGPLIRLLKPDTRLRTLTRTALPGTAR